jgi:signal transduction histidine kinase/HAMP domain-containing protein
MKLVTKLVIISFFAILIPMLIIVFSAAFLVFQNTNISQWEYLEIIQNQIEKDISSTELNYQKHIKLASDIKIISDKLYVYEKYWDRLSENIRAYDLASLTSLIEIISRENDIDLVAAYRRDGQVFKILTQNKQNKYIPDEYYKELIQKEYGKAVYTRYPDGIYMRILYPVFSDGHIVGILVFMRGLHDDYLHDYAETYSIDYALLSNNGIILNSKTELAQSMKVLASNSGNDMRRNFKVDKKSYTGLVRRFDIGTISNGALILYTERINIFNESPFLIPKLIFLVLLCLLIPVVTFFIKELRLIKSINSLVTATNEISDGNYNSFVELRSKDEIGMLSNNFNNMVTVLKKNKDELEQQNEELTLKNSYIDAVFQSLSINIIVLDEDQNIRVVSRNAESRLELSEDHEGSHLLSVSPFIHNPDVIRKTLDDVYSKKTFARMYSVKFGDTSFEMDFYPVLEETGRIEALVIVMNNITDRMEMERALMRSDKLASVGKLAAGLAHEINNPMSIILNHVQLLGTGKLTEAEETKFISRIETEIERVSRLINNLLKFSREETSQRELLNPGEQLEDVIGLFDPKAQLVRVTEFNNGFETLKKDVNHFDLVFKNQRIQIFITSRLSEETIYCGRDVFRQIFFNIIKNSIESSSVDCRIFIDIEKGADGIKIMLSDNGKGVTLDEQEKIFELFYSTSKTGTGLGLPLCRTLMNSFGGSIMLDSEQNQGITVVLLFPLKEAIHG